MLLLVIGPENSLTELAISAISQGLNLTGKTWKRHKANSLEEIGKIGICAKEETILIDCRTPDGTLLAHLTANKIPVLVVAPNALSLFVTELQIGNNVVTSWRKLSEDMSVLISAAANEAAIVCRPGHLERGELSKLVPDWNLAAPQLPSLFQDSSKPNGQLCLDKIRQNDYRVSVPSSVLEYCAAIEEQLSGSNDDIPVPVEGLLVTDGFAPYTGEIEVFGEPRGLICGPLVRIPVGHWTIRMIVEVSDEIAGTAWVSDVFVFKEGVGFTHARLDLFGVGAKRLEVAMSFEVADPHDAFEFRFALNERLSTRGVIRIISLSIISQK